MASIFANIIFPTIPYSKQVDPMWEDELNIAKNAGYNVLLYNMEENKLYFDTATPTKASLYRGWFMTAKQYNLLLSKVNLLISPNDYMASHECYGWVDKINKFTFPTQYQQVPFVLPFSENQKYFIKSSTKSFGKQSFVNSQDDVDTLVQLNGIQKGEILCVRDYVTLSSEPEKRFFCIEDEVYGYNGATLPESLMGAVKALSGRYFYSLDVAYKLDGTPIIVEIGDGQVSDLKEWDLQQFYDVVIANLCNSGKNNKARIASYIFAL